jgi:hypothetical protein
MLANRVPVIVNAVTPIVSDTTEGMVTIVAIPSLSFPMLPCCRLCFVVTDITRQGG